MPAFPNAPSRTPSARLPLPTEPASLAGAVPLTAVLQRFALLSRLANDEHDLLQTHYLRTVRLPDDCGSRQALIDAPAPCHAALRAFLGSLPDPVLHAVAALMHAASDGASDVIAHWIGVRRVIADRASAIESIAARRSRDQDAWAAATQLDLRCALDDLPDRLRLLEQDLRALQRAAVPAGRPA